MGAAQKQYRHVWLWNLNNYFYCQLIRQIMKTTTTLLMLLLACAVSGQTTFSSQLVITTDADGARLRSVEDQALHSAHRVPTVGPCD